MKRKVNLVGPSTLTVSLPSKWVEKNGIKKGDDIDLVEEGNSLTILYGDLVSKPIKEAELTIKNEAKVSTRSILGAYYRKGYDLLRIRFESESVFKSIKESANSLIGYEVVERKPNSCLVKSYLIETKEEFQNNLQRIINTIKTSQTTVKEDYILGKYNHLDDMEEYRLSGWKSRDLAMRILTKDLSYSESSSAYNIIIWSLEKINRNYRLLYVAMKEHKFHKNDKILKIYSELIDYQSYFFEALSNPSIEKIEYLHKHYNTLIDKMMKILFEPKIQAPVMYYLIENLRRIQDMTSMLIVISQ